MLFITIVQLCHGKMRAIQFGFGQLVHEPSYRDQHFFATVEFIILTRAPAKRCR
jgi:hypothetical protein